MNEESTQTSVDMEAALERYFRRQTDSGRFIDVTRLPFICDDLKGIHEILDSMSNDSKWVMRITIGSAAVFLPAVGWLLLQVIKNTSNIAALMHVTH